MFIANHYTRIGSKRYTPGEVIDQDIPNETKEWLLSKEAVYEVPNPHEAHSDLGNFSPDPGPDPEAAAGADAPEEDKEQPTADDAADDAAEIDMEAEPPEIDALDGIVSAGSSPQPGTQPVKKAASRTSAPRKDRKRKAK